jgi:exopolyphosphatase/guanosine-5'-triphosphate,3'-diphosphate pyrophosphatase
VTAARFGVVDLGTNTIRLLVAALEDGRLEQLDNAAAMTRLGAAIGPDGRIDEAKIAEVADIVAGYVERASLLGAAEVRIIATSAAREAANGDDLVEAVQRAAGVPLSIIDEDEEARLAFFGALASLDEPWEGDVGVVDVGGGSTEIVVGSAADGVAWSRSFRLGSGRLTDRFLSHDPPRPGEISRARLLVQERLGDTEGIPQPGHALAVAGSATNLRRMVGPLLDEESLGRALRLFAERPSSQIARQFDLMPDRARILPAGALVLQESMRRLGTPLWVGRGGIRQGALLDMAGASLR